MELVLDRGASTSHIYLEAAGVVTTLILAGRYFEGAGLASIHRCGVRRGA